MSIKERAKKIGKSIWTWLLAAVAAVGAFFGIDADAQATPVVDTLTWTAPTQYIDNTAIPAGTITGYRIVWGPAPTGTWPAANTLDVGLVLTRQVTRAETYGNRCYKVAALIGAVNGEWTGAACKNVQAPARAPGNLQVE